MDLKQIRYFVALAEERSFTAAAQRLHITQPPLSRQIQLLEESLGVTLIERDVRPLELTKAGRVFYEQGLYILRRLDQLQDTTRRLGQSAQEQLVIGFAASTLYGGLPLLIHELRAAYPELNMQFRELNSYEQVEALKSNRIDVGFGRARLHDHSIARITLREERLALAVPKQSELAQSDEPIPLSVLTDQHLIAYPAAPTSSFVDYVLNALHDRRIYPAHVHEVHTLQTALGLVAAGQGYCVMPTGARLRQDIHYRLIDSQEGVSIPIIFSHRKSDRAWYIEAILRLTEAIYRQHPELLHPDCGLRPGER